MLKSLMKDADCFNENEKRCQGCPLNPKIEYVREHIKEGKCVAGYSDLHSKTGSYPKKDPNSQAEERHRG